MGLGHAWIIVVIALIIVLIVVGPGKLSQLGAALGRSIKDFRKESAPPTDRTDDKSQNSQE